jgi:hypothetical protein
MGALFKVNKPKEPAKMPTMDDQESKRAAARAQQLLTSRSGRSSTVMSRDPQGSSGGTTAYGNKLMGQS